MARDFIPLDGFGSRQGTSSRPDLVRRYGIYRCLPDGSGHRAPDHHGCRHVMGTPATPLRLGPAQRPAFHCAGTGSKRLGRDLVALCRVPTRYLQTPAQKTGASCSPEGTSGGSADVNDACCNPMGKLSESRAAKIFEICGCQCLDAKRRKKIIIALEIATIGRRQY